MTVTPVLADQLEDAGVARAAAALPARLADRRRRGATRPRSPAECRTGLRGGAGPLPAGARAARRRRRRPAATLSRRGRGGAGRARRLGGDPRGAAAAGDRARAGGCSSTPGIRSHRRRFGWDGGFWLPECAYAPGPRVAASPSTGCAGSASTRAPTDRAARGAGPGRHRGRARSRCRSTGRRSSWLWSLDGYPSDPAHAQFAGKSLRGMRIWKVGGGAYDPLAAAARGAAPGAASSSPRSPTACASFARPSGRRGLLVFAIDTELLGHWWSEGPSGCAEVLAGAAAAGVRLLTVPEALAEHEPSRAPARRLELGRGQGPAHLGLAARSPTSPGPPGGWSCACCARSPRAARGRRRCAPPASCSPSRPATGPSSTAAARPATTRTSARPRTRRRRSRP